MAEKGGKGFSAPGKSSLKSASKSGGTGSSKGKEDGSAKSKKGRKKVQFDSEPSFSTKSSGKADSTFSKVNLGKGGKADKAGSAVKTKESQPLELKVEQELPKHAKCIMDCEAMEILQGIQDQMVILSEDPSIKIPVSFDRGLQYAKSHSNYSNHESVRRVLGELSKYGVSEGEICVIGNVCPESVEEAFALVPSLKAKKSKLMEPLKDVLSELTKLKQLT